MKNALYTPEFTLADIAEQQRKSKRDAINNLKKTQQAAGFVFQDHRYDSDTEALIQINGAAVLALIALSKKEPLTVRWTTADEQYVTLDAKGLLDLATAAGMHVNAIHQAARAHKDAIAALTDPLEIQSYNINAAV